jgi:hypothetical protein
MKYHEINFSHPYTKLKFPLIPTIRGVHWMSKKKSGYGLLDIKVKKEHFCWCWIRCMKPIQLRKIPLEFLRYDAHPLEVKNHAHFADRLNSFRDQRWNMFRVTQQSPMTLLLLEKETRDLTTYDKIAAIIYKARNSEKELSFDDQSSNNRI